MRTGEVYRNKIFTGLLVEDNQNHFIFTYDDKYFNDQNQPAISLTLPKTKKQYRNKFLFPFFFNMLSEGVNRNLQSRQLQIDKNDHFGLLLATTQYDTIGAITVKPTK